jgi:TolB-like protein/Tfp pilus assembly protein PilF
MSAEVKKEIQLEIGHVLFIDIVAYSKLSIKDQHAAVEELNELVRASAQFGRAEAEGRLLKIATGDGMALVFYTSPEAPAHCAVEISRALKEHSRLQLRMGIHSGPVSGVIDVNNRPNLAGAGINIAQRVMDCGDAGHILLSKHAAEDLEEYEGWRPRLHDLGTCEVKHRGRIGIANLYDSEIGNPQLPKKFQALQRHRTRVRWAELAVGLVVLAAIIAALVWSLRRPTRRALPIQEKSIAVLPFENRSEEKANAFFADGVQDEILTHLARIADLKVISRTSVLQYKSSVPRNLHEIGQQLGVAHLLEGSVQRAANRIRVNAQLIDARSDAHLWAQTYDRDLADVFAIQSEIAKTIADQLQAKLSPTEKTAIERRPTQDVQAFDLYTRAKNMFLTTSLSATKQGEYLVAIDLLSQAVARDPSFLQVYCLLAHAHDDLYFFGGDHTPERLRQAETAINAAQRVDPDAGETHLARAEHLYHGRGDYNGALAEIELAAGTLPNDSRIFSWTGFIARRQGKSEEALRNLTRAFEVDPRNLVITQQVALTYQALRRYAEAVAMWDRALTIKPQDIETRLWRAQADLEWKAETRPLHQMIDQIRRETPAEVQRIANPMFLCALCERDVPACETALVALGNNPFGHDQILFGPNFNQGVIARLANDQERARAAFNIAREQQEKIVQAQPDYGPAVCIVGLIDAGLGRKEEALQEGRRATELVPAGKDSFLGNSILEYFAIIAAWAGEKELALEQLEKAARRPSFGPTTYGQLKLHPFWDPLRGDPRFEKIVNSLAPKNVAK